MPAAWIFRLCEIKNASSARLNKYICIKFYGIMHWTLAYTTAYTRAYRTSRDHGSYGSTSCSHSLNGSKLHDKFSTKLGNGCWATGTPQKLCGPRTPYHVPRTTYPEQRITATET